MFRTSPPWSAIQQRRLSFLAEFNSDICHLPKAENIVADALTCLGPDQPPDVLSFLSPALPPPVPGISYQEMSTLQQSCPKVKALRQSSTRKVVSFPVSGSSGLLCDPSTGVIRPLVPEPMRRTVFDSVHQGSHPGKRASWRLVSQSFVLEFLAKDVNLRGQSCLSCQRSRVQTHVKSITSYPSSRT